MFLERHVLVILKGSALLEGSVFLKGDVFLEGNALFERSIFLERNVCLEGNLVFGEELIFGGEGTDCVPQNAFLKIRPPLKQCFPVLLKYKQFVCSLKVFRISFVPCNYKWSCSLVRQNSCETLKNGTNASKALLNVLKLNNLSEK